LSTYQQVAIEVRRRGRGRVDAAPRRPKLPAAQIRDLAALRWLHAGESVILTGPVGVGVARTARVRSSRWWCARPADELRDLLAPAETEPKGGQVDFS